MKKEIRNKCKTKECKRLLYSHFETKEDKKLGNNEAIVIGFQYPTKLTNILHTVYVLNLYNKSPV